MADSKLYMYIRKWQDLETWICKELEAFCMIRPVWKVNTFLWVQPAPLWHWTFLTSLGNHIRILTWDFSSMWGLRKWFLGDLFGRGCWDLFQHKGTHSNSSALSLSKNALSPRENAERLFLCHRSWTHYSHTSIQPQEQQRQARRLWQGVGRHGRS